MWWSANGCCTATSANRNSCKARSYAYSDPSRSGCKNCRRMRPTTAMRSTMRSTTAMCSSKPVWTSVRCCCPCPHDADGCASMRPSYSMRSSMRPTPDVRPCFCLPTTMRTTAGYGSASPTSPIAVCTCRSMRTTMCTTTTVCTSQPMWTTVWRSTTTAYGSSSSTASTNAHADGTNADADGDADAHAGASMSRSHVRHDASTDATGCPSRMQPHVPNHVCPKLSHRMLRKERKKINQRIDNNLTN